MPEYIDKELIRRTSSVDWQAQENRTENDRYFYSNCAIEAIRRKIADPKNITVTIVPKSEANCPHFLWSDGKHDFDFGTDRPLKWYEIFWFKGYIRMREIGFNEKYKNLMKSRRSRKD